VLYPQKISTLSLMYREEDPTSLRGIAGMMRKRRYRPDKLGRGFDIRRERGGGKKYRLLTFVEKNPRPVWKKNVILSKAKAEDLVVRWRGKGKKGPPYSNRGKIHQRSRVEKDCLLPFSERR